MLKINTDKMFEDLAVLRTAKMTQLEATEQAARSFAASRYYDEARTSELIKSMQAIEGDGLCATDRAKLNFLETYIEEVDDEGKTAETTDEVMEGTAVE